MNSSICLTVVSGVGLCLAGPLLSSAAAQGPGFKDVTKPADRDYCGVNFIYHHITGKGTENMGVAVGDYNNDGFDDLFFAQGKTLPNALYRNDANGTFTNVAAAVGVADPAFNGAGGLFLDYDNDGDLDLFAVAHPTNINPETVLYKLFQNTGAPNYTFTNVTSTAGFILDRNTAKGTSGGFVGGVAAGDYNKDGYLDIIVTYWQANNGQDQMRLFRSDAPAPGSHGAKRVFTDVTKSTGLDFPWPGETWQPQFVDLNRDGLLDIHVCMDFDLDLYLKNNGDGTFTDVASAVGLNDNPLMTNNEMGSAFGDVDNDGDLDVHKTNMGMPMDRMWHGMDVLYMNNTVGPNMSFVNVAHTAGVELSMWGWGDIFFDMDNDGDLDHATASGFKNGPWYNALHMNLWPVKESTGQGPLFEDLSDQPSGMDFTKMGLPDWRSTRGLSWFDYDNDGDIDLVSGTHSNDNDPFNEVPNETYGVFKNQLIESGDPRHWLKVQLYGENGSRNVANARITIFAGGNTQMREVFTGSSHISQEPDRQHFGVRFSTTVESVCVRWMDGTLNLAFPTGVDQTIVVQKGVDRRGDLNNDGVIDDWDFYYFMLLYSHPAIYASMMPGFPGREVADVNGDNQLNEVDWWRMAHMTGVY